MLNDWLENGWLKLQQTSKDEINTLLKKVNRDIQDSEKDVISNDRQLSIAYSACLTLASIPLRIMGYRIPEGGNEHYRTIESLRLTIPILNDTVILLHALKKKRHQVNYDSSGIVSDKEVDEAIETAIDLKKEIDKWIALNYPEYL